MLPGAGTDTWRQITTYAAAESWKTGSNTWNVHIQAISCLDVNWPISTKGPLVFNDQQLKGLWLNTNGRLQNAAPCWKLTTDILDFYFMSPLMDCILPAAHKFLRSRIFNRLWQTFLHWKATYISEKDSSLKKYEQKGGEKKEPLQSKTWLDKKNK